MQKGFVTIFILIGVVVLTGVIWFNYSTNHIKSNQDQVQTPLATAQPSPDPSPYKDDWQKYTNGQNIDGIIINYHEGWKVNYRKEYNLTSDYKAKYRITFDFSPPGWKESGYDYLGWGVINFDVYDPQPDITKFININYPTYRDNLTAKEVAKIGGKPTYLEEGKEDFYWLPRNVILGDKYSYELGHSQDGSDEFIENVRTKTGIYEYIKID